MIKVPTAHEANALAANAVIQRAQRIRDGTVD
jgi:hypothetical protein